MELSKIRLLRDDIKIWLVYAGSQRRFFETFRQEQRIFLNLPGFNPAEATFESEELIRRHLAMSDAISDYNRGAIPNAPSRNPANFNPFPYEAKSADARSFSAEVGNILRLFVDAKIGDLVISPAFGHFEPFLIGEIISDWSKTDDLAVGKLWGESVPTRRVKWLNIALARRDFSVRTSKLLQNRHAITLLDDDVYADVFDTVFPSYAWAGRSKLDLFGDHYRGKDPLQPYMAAKLFKYVMASVFAYGSAKFDEFQSLDIDAAIEAFYDENLVFEIHQNFNSPGKFTAIAGLSSFAALTAAALLLATAPADGDFDAQRAQVASQIEQSVEGAGKAESAAEIANFLDSTTAVAWKPIQKDLGVPAKESLGLSLDNKVEVATHRKELDAR